MTSNPALEMKADGPIGGQDVSGPHRPTGLDGPCRDPVMLMPMTAVPAIASLALRPSGPGAAATTITTTTTTSTEVRTGVST